MDQVCRPLKRALSTDSTDGSFASKIPTTTEPSGSGVIPLTHLGNGEVPEYLLLLPIATAGNNDTMDMRVIGWRRIGSGPIPGTLWIPCILGQFTCTLSAAVGIASAPVVATERFADTIIVHATITGAQPKTTETDSGGAASHGDTWITNPANDLVATIKLPITGVEKVEVLFDSTAAGTTAMNALFSLL